MIFSQEVSRYSATHLLPTSDSELVESEEYVPASGNDAAGHQSVRRPRSSQRLSSFTTTLFYITVAAFAVCGIAFYIYLHYIHPKGMSFSAG